MLAHLLREDLVHGNAGIEMDSLVGGETSVRKRVDALAWVASGTARHRDAVQIAQHQHLVAKWHQGAHRGLELEAGPSTFGNQSFIIMPFGTYTAPKRLIGLRRGLR